MRIRLFSLIMMACVLCESAQAAPCAPGTLGVSRVLTVDARATPAVGSFDYGVTLPLAPREVVLTFDDGPRPGYTDRVLKALGDECVRATFFMLGRQARANPALARQVLAAGHTVGTHTQNHPMHRMSPQRAQAEIQAGIDSVGNAVGRRAVAPFFRFPGLYRTAHAEQYLRSRGLMSWSIDVDSYDYRRSSGQYMLNRMLANIEKRRGGILLMHDMQPKTAAMLPSLLSSLKARGYRVVHVVPSGRDTAPELVAQAAPRPQAPAPRRVARNTIIKRGSFAEIFTSSVRR